jgi:hypothetical protein
VTDARLAVRQRLYDDFEFYAEHALKIRNKAADIVPLRLNEAQRRLNVAIEDQMAQTGRVRLIILKARQMGLSTVVGGRLFWNVSQRRAKKAIVVTHHADSTRALFDMTRRYFDTIPEVLKPSTRYSSRKELQFDKLDSGYVVATAGGDSIARGETIFYAHLSELAFWPKSSAAENFNGLSQAISPAPGSEVYIESTANGVTGIFYDFWKASERGDTGYQCVFLPWFIDPTYREAVPEGFERTPDEQKLVGQHGLDDGQLMFRRVKISQNGLDLFRQEYPATADEAFLTTGRPVFHPERIVELKEARPPFIERLALEGSEFLDHPRGELKVYLPYDPAETYYIGADVGAGVQRDFSCAQVQDSQRRQVACLRAQFDPDYFATVLYHLGTRYNNALLAVESNNHGILTCARLSKDFNYENFYTQVVYDKTTDEDTVKLGFATTSKSKPLIIDKLRAHVRDREVHIYDEQTLEEMGTYVVNENGAMEAEKGCHDDTVMALAICNHVNDGAFAPIVNLDNWYVKLP